MLTGWRKVAERCLADETWDATAANRALELIGKHLGMFVDRGEYTLKGAKIIIAGEEE